MEYGLKKGGFLDAIKAYKENSIIVLGDSCYCNGYGIVSCSHCPSKGDTHYKCDEFNLNNITWFNIVSNNWYIVEPIKEKIKLSTKEALLHYKDGKIIVSELTFEKYMNCTIVNCCDCSNNCNNDCQIVGFFSDMTKEEIEHDLWTLGEENKNENN